MHVACFAMRDAFSLMFLSVYGHEMSHVRAFRFVHALCSDVVVRVSALWSCSLFSLLFRFVRCLLFLVFVFVLSFSRFGNRLLEVTGLFVLS